MAKSKKKQAAADPEDHPLFSGEPELASSKPPWLTLPPPKRSKTRWPKGARSATWIRKSEECLRAHSERYRHGRKDPSGHEAKVGKAIHGALEAASQRRLEGKIKGLPGTVSPAELSHLVEYEKEARHDPKVLTEAIEVIASLDLDRIDLSRVRHVEELVSFRPTAGLLLAGYVDAISMWGDPQHPDRVEILDYKTGPGQSPDEYELFFNAQACLYLVCAHARWPSAWVTFRSWNLRNDTEQSVEWSPRLEQSFLARCRAALHSWVHGDDTPKTGKHCEYCPYRSDCSAYTKLMHQEQLRAPEGSLASKPIEELMALHRQASVVKGMADRRRKDCSELIEQAMGQGQRSYQAGRLAAIRVRGRKYRVYQSPGQTMAHLAEEAGVPLPELIDAVGSGFSETKLKAWLKTHTEEIQARLQKVIVDETTEGRQAGHVQVREIKKAALF